MAAAGYPRAVVERDELQHLLSLLESRGYNVVGPVLRDGAIVYDTVSRLDDLPAGWSDEQEPGRYSLRKRGDAALFGYGVGPQGWKRFLHPPEVRLFQVHRENGTCRILEDTEPPPRYAFFGVRACELAAIEAQDRVLTESRFPDSTYRGRRQHLLIIAVNCTQSASTCFCASMETGPRARGGFDLALTEVIENGSHCFVIEVGSAQGEDIVRELNARPASPELSRKADEATDRAATQVRTMNISAIRERLSTNFDHPRWDEVASRCLNCGNCTMVCPTCFCTTVEDGSDVTGAHAERWRKWDSCFTQAFSYIHGGSVRQSSKSRFRQWMMHKLAYWADQFGGSGCVGCGRCITWCPAAIDITEEADAICNHTRVSVTQSMEEDDGNS